MMLASTLSNRLSLPLIAAPMFAVSGLELVSAACRNGVIGAFPTANCRTVEELDQWLNVLDERLTPDDAPYCPNLIMRSDRIADDLACLTDHGVEMVITSVGSPTKAVEGLAGTGCVVLSDVASIHHARRSIEAGADGLVLLTAGAGGQTGWANGFAFARAVREFYDGTVVLAGGITDGQSLFAARALGCDLAYMGTKFISTTESLASADYKQMLRDSSLDDIVLTSAVTGLPTSMLRPSLAESGLDVGALDEATSEAESRASYGSGSSGPRRWTELWSAGHSVSGVRSTPSATEFIEQTRSEYDQACSEAGKWARRSGSE